MSEAIETALVNRLREAVKLRDEALATHESSGAILVSRTKEVGTILIECRKSFPKVKDWEAFLKVEGLFKLILVL